MIEVGKGAGHEICRDKQSLGDRDKKSGEKGRRKKTDPAKSNNTGMRAVYRNKSGGS